MEARIVEMAFLVSRCTVIHNNKAQRACTGTTFPSRSIPDRGKRNEKCSLSRVWRCTLLAALFLFFLLWSADRFFFSLFFLQLRVSFRIKGREVSIFFFLSIIDVKTIFLFIFLFEYLPVFGEQLARMISSVEERRILYGILYGMDFQPSLVDNKRKTMELNLRPMRKIWKSSNYYTLWRKLGEGRRRKRSTIWQISGRKRIVDWLRVALFMTISRSSRQRDELGFDEKEHQEGNEGKEGREKKRKEQKRKFTRP